MAKDLFEYERIYNEMEKNNDRFIFLGIMLGAILGGMTKLYWPSFLSVEILRFPLLIPIGALISAIFAKELRKTLSGREGDFRYDLTLFFIRVNYYLSCLSMILAGWSITFGLAVVVNSF